MEIPEIIDKIKANAYWRVIIRPTIFEKERYKNLKDLFTIIENCSVSLRGWNYPHLESHLVAGSEWIECQCESFMGIEEYWRFYQSGQFVHFFNFYENSEYKAKNIWTNQKKITPKGYVGILCTLYRMTEIFEFATRLAQKGVFNNADVYIGIYMSGIEGYELFFEDWNRILYGPYITLTNQISFELSLSAEELIANGRSIALDKTIYVFERFNWMNAPRNILYEDQKKLLERRL